MPGVPARTGDLERLFAGPAATPPAAHPRAVDGADADAPGTGARRGRRPAVGRVDVGNAGAVCLDRGADVLVCGAYRDRWRTGHYGRQCGPVRNLVRSEERRVGKEGR